MVITMASYALQTPPRVQGCIISQLSQYLSPPKIVISQYSSPISKGPPLIPQKYTLSPPPSLDLAFGKNIHPCSGGARKAACAKNI